MRNFLALWVITMLLVTPGVGFGEMAVAGGGSETSVSEAGAGAPDTPPPIGQKLVPEGYFASRLAEALNLGTPESDAQAESLLTAVGIAPKNGWIENYPVTPDILEELAEAIEIAASSGTLAMSADDAKNALQGVVDAELGVTISAEPPDQFLVLHGGDYVEPAAVNDYYYTEGPPVVTYYPPPPDYSYLYAWVSSPFWCDSFFFPGFFVLSDFDMIVVGHGHHDRDHGGHFYGKGRHHHGDRFEVTNHVFDSRTKRVFTIDPTRRETQNSAPLRVRSFSRRDFDQTNRSPVSKSERRRREHIRSVTPTFNTPRSSIGGSRPGDGGAKTFEIGRSRSARSAPTVQSTFSGGHSMREGPIVLHERPADGSRGSAGRVENRGGFSRSSPSRAYHPPRMDRGRGLSGLPTRGVMVDRPVEGFRRPPGRGGGFSNPSSNRSFGSPHVNRGFFSPSPRGVMNDRRVEGFERAPGRVERGSGFRNPSSNRAHGTPQVNRDRGFNRPLPGGGMGPWRR
jgi:hypothetical protein